MKQLATFLVYVCLSSFLLSICWAGKTDDKKRIIAKAGKYVLTAEALDQRIDALPPQYKKMIEKNPQYKQELIDRWIKISLLAQEAKARKLDTNKVVAEKISDSVNTVLAQELVIKYVVNKIKVTDGEVKSYYSRHKSEFESPETMKARHILIKVAPEATPEAWKEAETKALGVKKKIEDGEDFATIAKSVSEDPGTRDNGGDLGFFGRGQMVPEFEKAAFALKTGQVSDIIKTQFGYHIIKAEEKKDPKAKPLEEVSETVKNRLKEEKQEKGISALLDDLRKKYGVQIGQ